MNHQGGRNRFAARSRDELEEGVGHPRALSVIGLIRNGDLLPPLEERLLEGGALFGPDPSLERQLGALLVPPRREVAVAVDVLDVTLAKPLVAAGLVPEL